MICKKEFCTGCFSCYNICPKKAISMCEDEYGFVYPVVDKDKCINCGLCKRACPQQKKLNFQNPITAYAMYYKSNPKRKQSTSGGAASAIAEAILKQGGTVYGASNIYGTKKLTFIRIDSLKDLYKIKGTKYVHCYIEDTYVQAKKDLNKNKKVLFIGTPCQVAGLYAYLQKPYNNLITVDIICHGVPSQKLLFEEIESQGINLSDIYTIQFRVPKGSYLTLLDKNQKELFSSKSNMVLYYINFLNGNIFRENCYSCKYAKNQRISDLTIGDFWGINKSAKIYDDMKKGISLIMPNTKKGEEIINKIKSLSIIEERPLEEAIKGNPQLNFPVKKRKKNHLFRKKYRKLGYKKTMKKLLTNKEKLTITLRKNKIIYKTYKFIKKHLKH